MFSQKKKKVFSATAISLRLNLQLFFFFFFSNNKQTAYLFFWIVRLFFEKQIFTMI